MHRIAITLAALATALSAQTPVVFGRALLVDGKPWIGAQITVVSRPLGRLPSTGGLDRRSATTDGDGRFRVEVSPGRVYSCWATQSLDAGAHLRSAILEGVVPADAVTLRADGGPLPAREIVVRGREHWQHAAPLRFALRLSAENAIVIPLEIDGDQITLPPLPLGKWHFEAAASHGMPLLASHQNLLAPGMPEQTMQLPRRTRALIKVTDGWDGAGVAGAVILRTEHGVAVPIGTTDARGFAVVDRPECYLVDGPNKGEFRDVELNIAVQASGFQLGMVYPQRIDMLDAEGLSGARAQDKPHAWAQLRRGVDARGRLMAGPDHPLANRRVVVMSEAFTWRGEGQRSTTVVTRVVDSDAAGSFALSGLPTERPVSLAVHLSDPDVAALPAAWRPRLDRLVNLLVPPGKPQIGTLDLTDLTPVDLAVRLPDGAPAIGTRVMLRANVDLEPRWRQRRADRAGRVRLLWQAADAMQFVAGDSRGWASGTLTLDPRAPTKSPTAIPIRLKPATSLRGRVTFGRDRTAPGIAVGVRVWAVPDDGPEWRGDQGKTWKRTKLARFPLSVLLAQFDLDAVTGADGAFTAAVPDMIAAYVLTVRQQIDGVQRFGFLPFEHDPSDPELPHLALRDIR